MFRKLKVSVLFTCTVGNPVIFVYLFRKLKVSVLFTCTAGNPVITNIVPDFSRDKETLQEGIFRDLQSYMSYSDSQWYNLNLEEETVVF